MYDEKFVDKHVLFLFNHKIVNFYKYFDVSDLLNENG